MKDLCDIPLGEEQNGLWRREWRSSAPAPAPPMGVFCVLYKEWPLRSVMALRDGLTRRPRKGRKRGGRKENVPELVHCVRKVPTHKLDPVNLLDLQTNMEMEGYFRPRLRVCLTFIVVTYELSLSLRERKSLSVKTPHFVLTRKDKGRREER